MNGKWKIGLIVSVLATASAVSGQMAPLSFEQISALVEVKTPDSVIAAEIKDRKLSFQLSRSALSQLKGRGAGVQTQAVLASFLPPSSLSVICLAPASTSDQSTSAVASVSVTIGAQRVFTNALGRATFSGLEPGSYRAIVEKPPAYPRSEHDVTLAEGGSEERVLLVGAPARLSISLGTPVPASATIDIDYHPYGVPLKDLEVPSGKHLVSVKALGYLPYSTYVTLEPGESRTLDPLLVPDHTTQPRGPVGEGRGATASVTSPAVITQREAVPPRDGPILANSGPMSLDALGAAIARGESVEFKVKYNTAVDYPLVYLADGFVTVSKATITFRPTYAAQGFAVLPEKIVDLSNQPQQASWVLGRTAMTGVPSLHLKVAVRNKNGSKEDKKDFHFVSPGARTVGQGPGGTGLGIDCTGCDDSMNILYALLQQVRAFGLAVDGRQATVVAGKFVRKDKSTDYVELYPNGTFHLSQGGKSYSGVYEVHGDAITVQGKNVKTSTMRLIGERIVDPNGSSWEKVK